MPSPRTFSSYLIRIWCEPMSSTPGSMGAVQILTQNIQTGEQQRFSSMTKLFGYLYEEVALFDHPPADGGNTLISEDN